MAKIVPSHPHLVGEYQRVILSNLDDQDMSIRMRALELVSAMVPHIAIFSPWSSGSDCIHRSTKITYTPSHSSSFHIWPDQILWQQFLQQCIRCRNTHSRLTVYKHQVHSPEPVHTD